MTDAVIPAKIELPTRSIVFSKGHAAMPLLLVLSFLLTAPDLVPIGHLDDPALREVSGIVRSRTHKGVFWVHNDSGNLNDLYAITLDGKTLQRYRMPFFNVDWEDVAIDSRGRLYLGDIGNNGTLLPIRAVHRFDEPNPSAIPPQRFFKVTSCFYTFAEGKRFDSEGMFVLGSSVCLITKRLDGKEAEIHRLSFDPPSTWKSPQVPEKFAVLPGFVEPATGADLTPDERWLAVCSSKVARVYSLDKTNGLTLSAEVRYKERQVEAIAWDDLDLILTDEQGSLFRISRKEWQSAKPKATEGRRTR